VSFVGDVTNHGTINSGNAVAGKTTNTATINGDFTFNASSTNSGTVNGNAILNASSTNTGTITGTATFNMYTALGGAVTFGDTIVFIGTGYVTGNLYDSASVQITSWIFNASSTNTGILKGDAVFNGTSSNAVSGTVQGNAIFNDTTRNLGTITGNSDVYSPVVRPLGGTTNGQVTYHNYAGLYFNDSAVGHGVAGKWDDILNWWTDAGTTVHSPIIPTAGDDVIILSGNITISSITASVNTATFQGTSNNGINIYLSSTSTSASLFNASSTNSGTIHGNATFTGPDTESSGTVTGYITRQYNAGVYVVVRDFTHNGVHWIVQAINGASVDLSGATYSLITNAFQALNNGIFSAWNALISSGSSGVPVLSITSPVSGTNIKWAPVVSWGTSNLCQYKIDSGSYVSVICSNNGSDIPRPTAGAHTIFFKSTDAKSDPTNDIAEKSVSFTYDNTQPVDTNCLSPLDEATRPYYYLTSNVGNCTVTASTTIRGDDDLGHFYSMGSITGSSTNIALTNVTATGTISNFNNITVSSSTLSGAITVNGIFNSDALSRFGNTTIESGGTVVGGTFVGTLLNKIGGTITNSTTTPVTVALSTTNNGTINGGFTFNADSTNSGTINGDLTFGNLLSINGAVTFSLNTAFSGTGVVSGNIKDYQGNIITRWIFNDDSANTGLTKGNAFFNNLSTNSGTVSGNAYFSGSSLNAGTVTGNADVYHAVSVPITGVNGTITYHSYPNAPSFNNAAGDRSWTNTSNWFTDTTFAIPLGRTPVTGENIVLFASTTLPSNITNNIFIAVSSSTLDGAGHTLTGNISGDGAYGGHNAYNFNLENITVTGTTTANGGNGTPVIDGGKGGVVNVSTSSTGVIAVNGGDPQHNGGDAGSAVVVNSYATVAGTPLLAIGGDSSGCGYGGAGGNISLVDSSGYVLITATGADATTTIAQGGGCVNPPTGSHKGSGSVTTRGAYTSPSARATLLASAVQSPANSASLARIFANLQTILLPINFVGKLTLPALPKFGFDTTGSFSFASPIEKFLVKFFALPISTLGAVEKTSPLLRTLLLKQGIITEQAVASLSVTPKRLIDTNSEGLFTVKGLTSKLTGDSKNIVYQKVVTQPGKTLIISLIPTDNNPIIGTFNGKTVFFDKNNTTTLTAPKNPGTYFLKTKSSPISLAIVVSVPTNIFIAQPLSLWDRIVNWFWRK
jgi:hypothetical protein